MFEATELIAFTALVTKSYSLVSYTEPIVVKVIPELRTAGFEPKPNETGLPVMFIIANPLREALEATIRVLEAVTVAVVGAEAVRAVFVLTGWTELLLLLTPGF